MCIRDSIKSDHAYHIVKHLPAMAAAAGKMVHDAIEAFINRDLDAAVSIIKRDDEVDKRLDGVEMCIRDRYSSSSDNFFTI